MENFYKDQLFIPLPYYLKINIIFFCKIKAQRSTAFVPNLKGFIPSDKTWVGLFPPEAKMGGFHTALFSKAKAVCDSCHIFHWKSYRLVIIVPIDSNCR